MGIPLDELSGSGDAKALHATVEKFAKESGRQTKQLIWLTWAIIGLTARWCSLSTCKSISLSLPRRSGASVRKPLEMVVEGG